MGFTTNWFLDIANNNVMMIVGGDNENIAEFRRIGDACYLTDYRQVGSTCDFRPIKIPTLAFSLLEKIGLSHARRLLNTYGHNAE